MKSLPEILDALESFYGAQTPGAPVDPYLFLVWWHCGYPPSEERCARGFAALQEALGLSAADLLAASTARIARALKAGGMVPEVRAARLKEVARRVTEDFAGDLKAALQRLPLAKARTALKKFPGIGAPGAERMLLFAGIAPLAAVPSACPHVLVRIESGPEPDAYNATYARARAALERLPAEFAVRTRAYLLLQRHGRELCKCSKPKCELCPVARSCAFIRRAADRRRTSRPKPR